MTRLYLMAKIMAIVGLTFALLELGFLFHDTRIDVTPVLANLGLALKSAVGALEAARQTTADVDAGVSYEVAKIKKPPSKAMRVVIGIAEVLGKFVL